MEYLLELISSLIKSDGAQRWLFVLLIGSAAFALGLSLAYIFFTITSPLRSRLNKIDKAAEWTNDKSGSISESENNIKLSSVAAIFTPRNISQHIQGQLLRAGIRSESAPSTFYAIKTLSLITGFSLLVFSTRLYPGLSTTNAIMLVVLGSYISLILPNIILDKMERRRMRLIRHAFADALDLFVVCIESGLGIAATIQRVAQEIEVSHPELAEELTLVSTEMRLGVDRIEALKGLVTRTGLDEIRGLVALIDQSVRFGTGIAETLRVYAEEFRDRRMQKAEEAAAKIGTKLIFPLTFCIWPGFFVVAVGPAILSVLQAFK